MVLAWSGQSPMAGTVAILSFFFSEGSTRRPLQFLLPRNAQALPSVQARTPLGSKRSVPRMRRAQKAAQTPNK